MFGEDSTTSGTEVSLSELFSIHGPGGMLRALKGLALYRKVDKYIDLLLDVHGHQIFLDAAFNGDP
jgi:hypothetical protein